MLLDRFHRCSLVSFVAQLFPSCYTLAYERYCSSHKSLDLARHILDRQAICGIRSTRQALPCMISTFLQSISYKSLPNRNGNDCTLWGTGVRAAGAAWPLARIFARASTTWQRQRRNFQLCEQLVIHVFRIVLVLCLLR